MSQREQRSRNSRDTSSTYTIVTSDETEDEIVNRNTHWRISNSDRTDNLADSICSNASTSSTCSSSSSTILAPRPVAAQTTVPQPIQEQQSSQPTNNVVYGDEEEPKRCWICFGEDEDSEGRWVKPCKCSLICHEECLLNWITENQKGQPYRKVTCPQCATPYQLVERMSLPLYILSKADTAVHLAAPYITVVGLTCSALISSTTYGAYAVLTLFGPKHGERIIGRPGLWTWRTWVGLPMIPVVLIASRSRWADGILPFVAVLMVRASGGPQQMRISWPPSPAVIVGFLPWIRLLYNNVHAIARQYLSRKLVRGRPGSRQIEPTNSRPQSLRRSSSMEYDDTEPDTEPDMLIGRDGRDIGTTVVGALLWPAIGNVIGSCLNHIKVIRRFFPEPFHRNVLGGCLFVIAKV
ncbi:hypothetical protein NQZ79_g5633 [Umbelopsis isabellina]|nr:hypothetical protein NQZ79_g5633 [Umbelopsis isabellina]